jgi:hypothetical protein
MFRRLILSLIPLLAVVAQAQTPIRVPFECAEDQLQSAGLLCTEDEPCAIYLELSAIAPLGKKLYLAGNLHANAGTLSSILLASEDGGLTWKEPSPRIPGAALDQIQFHDLEHGWAAGETQVPLPADPFFLITSDGGQTWRKRPVTDEGGPGALQTFWFDSATHGELIVDAGRSSPAGRYVSYETETGGDTWMVRSETGKLPALKRAPPAGEADFRIRAVGEKTYQIEKRSGEEKWDTMASFLIEAASCKLKPAPAKEPPAITEQPEAKDYVEELKLGTPAKTTATPSTTPAVPVKKKGPGF